MMRDDLTTVVDAVVKVDTAPNGHGSGVLIDLGQKRGLVLTCYHVVKGETSIEVEWQGQSFEAKVVASDPGPDLALLGIEVADLPALKIASAGPDELAEVCIGGYPHEFPRVVVEGRYQRYVRQAGFKCPLYLVTAAGVITTGISGGPVADARSEVVGLVTLMHHVNEIPMFGAGYAIPLTQIKKFIRRVQNTVSTPVAPVLPVEGVHETSKQEGSE